jgi:NDP-sugar pyrophosphorylase family protein
MTQTPTLIILAGGASSRMWPLREKSLIRFGAESLLLTQLRRYQALGFADVIIVANPENEPDIHAQVQAIEDLQVRVVVQEQPRGMGDALLQAAPLFADRPDVPVYINQVHDVVELALHERMLAQFRAKPDESILAAMAVESYFPGGYLTLDADGRIQGVIEKPGAGNEPSNLVSMVVHIHSHAGRLFAAIAEEYAKPDSTDDHYERAMSQLMQTQTYRAMAYQGHWSALKYPWHVLDIMDYFLGQIKGQQVAESAFIAPTASLVGDVFIGENARIFPGAAVVGPAYIGAGVIVGNNALVRNSMVLEGANVGFTTEVARSYVAEGCQMHACRVLDSVFAPDVNFSAGCTTANLRIDKGFVSSTVKGDKLNTGRDKLGAIVGAGAFLGVDVMTMPGVKVGEAAEVGPGVHVQQDIQNRQRVYVKQSLVVVDPD